MNLTFKRILIAPLDWGLGHATRCVPVIRSFQKMGCLVIIATNGKQKKLLEQEFPNASFLNLSGYNIHYSKNKWALGFVLLKQLFKIFSATKKENKWLDNVVDEHKIDLVISDNRFGLYTKKTPCIFITHQLKIKAPFIWVENWLQKINYSFINRYTQCWVPDFEGEKNIAGSLSHPAVMPAVPVFYLGMLSRFEKQKQLEIKYNYCILLSGPEPQRTLLEKKILATLNKSDAKILLVRGKPDSKEILHTSTNVEVKNHLLGNELEQAILQSNIIISRSGYTTVMEIIALQKKSILIPTPGQTEQEYLGEKLMQQYWCYTVKQAGFSFQKTVAAAENFNYQLPELPLENLTEKLQQILSKLSTKLLF